MTRAAAAGFLRAIDERRKTLRAEVEDDVAPLRGLTLEQRGKILESVCRDAIAIIRARPDSVEALRRTDPRSAESLATWMKIVDRYRHGRD